MQKRFYLPVLLFLFFAAGLFGQDLETLMTKLEWREIGPANMGGRVTDIVGIPGDPTTFYIGGADGGVFKTENGGTTFEALFTDQRAYSVGALAIAPSDHNVLWLGSGEGDPRNSVGYGYGVYRSIDGGETWEHLGLEKTERIKRIVVHPENPDVACVCALGREWGSNKERGVFKTTDGGKSWKHVLSVNEDTGCSDLAMDMTNPRIMYAGMWTFRRRPWRFDGGGGETAVYRSKDGGETWEKAMKGLPEGPMARIGLSVSQSDPNIVYLITEFPNTSGTLFRSDNRGSSWELVNKDPNINFRPFYYSDVRVDPNNPNILYTLSGRLSKSTDGGRTFQTIARDVHGDHQSFWIDPENSDRLLSGSDGGFQVSYDQGETWDIINNVALAQFYQLDIDMQDPYYVYGGLQDNGCWRGPSNSLYEKGILKRHWKRLSYGDGYYAVPVPGAEHEVYTNLQGGVPFHVNAKTGVVRSIHPFPKIIGSAGDAIEDHRYRFNWDAPLHISPHDPNTVFFGGNVLFRSRDKGHSWEVISPDVTTDDKSKQRTSGGEVYQDNTAAEFHCSILTIAESPVEEGVIWLGTDDGNIQVTRNGGDSWENVNKNVPGLPDFSWIAKIHASEHHAGTAFMAVDNHRSDDFTPHAYMTENYGRSWKKIVDGLPEDDYVKVIRQDPRDPEVLYVGMEHGIYISWDKGDNWTRINQNLPPVSIRDLRIHPRERDLVVGTHGRGVWILDDALPLTQYDGVKDENVHVFPVRTATRWNMYGQVENMGQRAYIARNPPFGAIINYWLKEEPEDPVTVKIRDADGLTVRTLTDSNGVAGFNRIVWDLCGEGAVELAKAEPAGWWSGRMRPYVVPGMYRAELRVNGEQVNTDIEVRGDPRLGLEKEAYLTQYDHTNELIDLLSQTHRMINESEVLLEQLATLKKSVQLTMGSDGQDITEAIDRAVEKLESLRADWKRPPPAMTYRQKPRLREEIRSLIRAVNSVQARPTVAQGERLTSLEEETKAAVVAFEEYIENEISEVNKLTSEMQRIQVKRVKP